jgi:hypothetical protein
LGKKQRWFLLYYLPFNHVVRMREQSFVMNTTLISFRAWRKGIGATLFSEVCSQFVFLLFGQIGLNDLELLPLDRLSDPVRHGSARKQEQS